MRTINVMFDQRMMLCGGVGGRVGVKIAQTCIIYANKNVEKNIEQCVYNKYNNIHHSSGRVKISTPRGSRSLRACPKWII